MPREAENLLCFVGGGFFGFAFLMFLLWLDGQLPGDIRLKSEAEAVRHGAATWTVDESGNRVFQWKGETR